MTTKEGVIIKTQKYKESSKIIYVITKDGMESFLVKSANNIKGHNYSYSQELTKIGFNIPLGNKKSGFNIVTSGVVLDNYTNIKTDMNKMKSALYTLELAYLLNEHVEDHNLFYNFLLDILDKIDNGKFPKYYELIFALKMLYLVGIGPLFTKCVVCDSQSDLIGFDFESGGMKCIKCMTISDKYYSKDIINATKFLYLTKLSDFSDELFEKIPDMYNDIRKFVDEYYKHYLGFNSNVNKVMKELKVK